MMIGALVDALAVDTQEFEMMIVAAAVALGHSILLVCCIVFYSSNLLQSQILYRVLLVRIHLHNFLPSQKVAL